MSTSVVTNNEFGSQPGTAVLRYEKCAKDEAALKKKETAEAVKKTKVDKAKAAELAAELFFQMTHRVTGPRRDKIEYEIVILKFLDSIASNMETQKLYLSFFSYIN